VTGDQWDRARPGTLALRAFLTVLVVAMVVLWVYAFFLAPSGNPDRLEDRSWPTAAEARCLTAREAIAKLTPAARATDVMTRADDIDLATDVVVNLVADLGQLSGGTADDHVMIEKWLADWDVYIGDRRHHAVRLRLEGDVRPLLTALPSGSGSFVKRMNGFARVNDMEACLDPGDM